MENWFIVNPSITDGLILFAKYPQPGKIKTRLAAKIGDAQALELYKRFLTDKRTLFDHLSCARMINYAPNTKTAADYFAHLFSRDSVMWPQHGDDLGERMNNAFLHGFEQNVERLLLVGSDSPQLSARIVHQAFDLLKENDVVLGPSTDGGYYLIGFKKDGFTQAAFETISWSTAHVLKQTTTALKAANRTFGLLPELTDVDVVEDLKALMEEAPKGLQSVDFIMRNHIL